MIKNEQITTTVTRTVSVEFNRNQIDAILREACGFDEAAGVQWDIADGCIRSVCVVSTTFEQS